MEISVKKYIIVAAFDKAFGVAARTTAVPAFQNVLFSVKNEGTTISGGDGEVHTVVAVEQIEVNEEGKVLIPPKIHDIVKLCPDADINIKTENGVIIVECEQTVWNIRQEYLEYPSLDVGEAEEAVLIPKLDLSKALQRCKPAIDSQNIRMMYSYIQVADNKMRATDGSKFHQVDFPYRIDGLIPTKAVNEILKYIKSMAVEEVFVSQTDRHYVFGFDSDRLIVTKHAVEYPDVEGSMLKPAMKNNCRLALDKKLFIDAVKRVALTADTDTNYMVCRLSEDLLNLLTVDKYGNSSSEVVDVYWSGGEIEIGINHNYLMDMLSVLTNNEVVIFLGNADKNTPSTLCFHDDNFIGVLVQLRPDLSAVSRGSKRVASSNTAERVPSKKVSAKSTLPVVSSALMQFGTELNPEDLIANV